MKIILWFTPSYINTYVFYVPNKDMCLAVRRVLAAKFRTSQSFEVIRAHL